MYVAPRGTIDILPEDQRGVSRPQGPRPDIGAYEVPNSNMPDLKGTWRHITLLSDNKLQGNVIVTNAGQTSAGKFYVKVYASKDGVTPGTLLKTYTIMRLKAGTSNKYELTYSSWKPAWDYVMALIDPGNKVFERNERNNTAVHTVP